MINAIQQQGDVFPTTSACNPLLFSPFTIFRGEILDNGSGGGGHPPAELPKQRSETAPLLKPRSIPSLESIITSTTQDQNGIGRKVVEWVEEQAYTQPAKTFIPPPVKMGVYAENLPTTPPQLLPPPVYRTFITPTPSYGEYCSFHQEKGEYHQEEVYEPSTVVEYQANPLTYSPLKTIDARPFYQEEQRTYKALDKKGYSKAAFVQDTFQPLYDYRGPRKDKDMEIALEARVGKRISKTENYLEAFALLLSEQGYNVEVQQHQYRDTHTGEYNTGSILVDKDDPESFYHLFVNGHTLDFEYGKESPYEIHRAREGDLLKATKHKRDLKKVDSKEFLTKKGDDKGACFVVSDRVDLETYIGHTYQSLAEQVLDAKCYTSQEIDEIFQSGALFLSGRYQKGNLVVGEAITNLEEKVGNYSSVEISVDLKRLRAFYR